LSFSRSSSRSSSRVRGFAVALSGSIVLAGCDGVPPCPDVFFETEIAVPATHTTVTPTFSAINATTAAGATGTVVSIVDDQGTVAFDGRGPVPAFIYAEIPYPADNTTLYAGVGIDDGAWLPFWLYCSSDGHLTEVFGEMTDRDRDVFPDVDGTCVSTGALPTMTIDIPAHTLRHTALTCGFQVTAPAGATPIDLLGSQPGSASFMGDSVTVLPFHGVDCRTGCGSPGWYELHAITWDQITQSVGFEIFYLDASGVALENGVLLPSGNALAVEGYPNAVWSLDR
jgi:hypothetical protein